MGLVWPAAEATARRAGCGLCRCDRQSLPLSCPPHSLHRPHMFATSQVTDSDGMAHACPSWQRQRAPCVIVADAPFAGAPLDCRVQQLHWLIGQLHEIISAIIDVQHEPAFLA